MGHYDIARKIEEMDPERDAVAICHLLAGYEFPWDITRALEIALLRTFCVPSIAQLLDHTGEFQHHTQKRYDDTGVIVSELFKWGYEHPRGQGFLQRMNAIHGRYPIGNSDYLYVLSTFIYEPVRWCDRFGWRPLSDLEKQAMYHFWVAVGQRMGITDIPDSYGAFEQYNQTYEQQHFAYAAANQRVAGATRAMLLGWFPMGLRSLANQAIPALLDAPLLNALGWQPAPASLTQLLENGLKVRSRFLRKLPPRSLPDFFADQSIRSYPQGYGLNDIGPPSLLADLNSIDQKEHS
ncbi:oxygenase MpaB family protein [Leptothoe sp. PORK10 BA2]|uniref:oxygenase MpaB family protein n=1 Tax=Leptothoe sp. PORK10 BA2 TaxID=3110254 RepID=UPI002B20B9C2|nr:oxygenase MpaB family protein [Leptothoe sp. PORK10 BA2]MEA5466318.1 oxygenase MpaB family protein [Leptothoe sp. PORK10 BA2]